MEQFSKFYVLKRLFAKENFCIKTIVQYLQNYIGYDVYQGQYENTHTTFYQHHAIQPL